MSFSPARSLPHVLLITPLLLLCARPPSAALPGVKVPDWPRRLPCRQSGPLCGSSGPRGPRCAGCRRDSVVALLEQLAEGGDVDLRHLKSLRFRELLLALQVGDDAPQPVEGDVEPQHPPPLPRVRSEASPPLRTLQGALVRVEVMQRTPGGAQAELHDGARRLLVVAGGSVARQLLRAAALQQGVDVRVERRRARGTFWVH